MRKLIFWQSWAPTERNTVIGTLLIIFSAFIFLSYTVTNPLANIIPWSILSQLQTIPVFIDRLTLGDWQYNISVPSNMVHEWFVASPLQIPIGFLKVTLFLQLLGLCFVLAAITTLQRFWYLAGIILIMILTALSRTEVLGLSPTYDKTVLLSLFITYGSVSYYFHAFRPDISTVTRFSIFSGITALFGLLIGYLSPLSTPALTFLAYSFPIWITASILFLILTATEIFYGFVWLTTSKETASNSRSILQFSIIAILYLLLLALTYVYNTRMGTWGIALVSPFILAGAASFIGLFNFKNRCDATEDLHFRTNGFWLYAGLFLITIGFTTSVALSANDPLLETLEDFVVAGQLGMGIAFVAYILINFYPLFQKGLEVHKVLYKPLIFGLTKARLFGFGILVLLLSMQKLFPISQALAGYFNGLADVHLLNKELTLAEHYYKMSLQQEFQNHKANYSLASLALEQGDENAATFYYKQATLKKPSAHAYIGLSQVLLNENMYFEALYNLKEGLNKFPNEPHLLNNIGLYYAKTSLADSAYYYLQLADQQISGSAIPASNILALLGTTIQDSQVLDSLINSVEKHNDLSWQTNWLALRNIKGDFSALPLLKEATAKDSLLSATSYAYWVNYGLNQARNRNDLAHPLLRLSDLNNLDNDELLLTSVYNEFYNGDKSKAIQALLTLAKGADKNRDTYAKIAGHWFLQLGLYQQAIQQFQEVSDPEAVIGLAISHTLNQSPAIGGIVLEKLIDQQADSLQVRALQDRLAVLQKPIFKTDSLLATSSQLSEETIATALRLNPFDEKVIKMAVAHEKLTHKDTQKAFSLVVNALKYNDESATLWSEYALLALDLGLLTEAKEAEQKVYALASDADYHAFSTRYQAQVALIEKQKAEFQ